MQAATKVNLEVAPKVTLRKPILLPYGEGRWTAKEEPKSEFAVLRRGSEGSMYARLTMTKSLAPEKVARLRKKLYDKAKQEPSFRFYSLYDKICGLESLQYAYALAKANKGAPGVDGIRFEEIEEQGVDRWLGELREELEKETYRPQPVKRVMIPKAGGGERPLGIPTIKDRVVQTAAVLYLEPIFEADFKDNLYGYRPGRSAHDALKEVQKRLWDRTTHVVDADLSKYFDSIPHADLLKSVARRVSDGKMLRLIKLWLKSPVVEQTGTKGPKITGGKKCKQGVPQGGVISPLLANIYINRFVRHWEEKRSVREARSDN